MAKKLLSITVKGKNKDWSFNFYGEEKYLNEWRADGLEIDEVENIIPAWVIDIGMLKPWCFFQDIFNLKFKSAFELIFPKNNYRGKSWILKRKH